jgi:glycosyltransferase involved in cell wall biosynthesis
MRIGFVSFEYPPDTAFGGISTYVVQITRCLAEAGVDVEVFCGSATRSDTSDENGVRIHRVKADRMTFPTAVVPVFLEEHRTTPFDVLEGPDFLAEARYVTRALVDLPYVVKLHTPYYFARKFGRFPYNREQFRNQMRLLWYVAKTRNVRALSSHENPLFKEEREHLLGADEISAPSQAIASVITRAWGIDPRRISLVPFTYEAPPELLAIPIGANHQRISFVGRLEWRKGVQDLAEAIPIILKRYPEAKFRFVGASGASPKTGVNMRDYMSGLLQLYEKNVEFVGRVPANAVARYLLDTDICVFPSRWESFGFVVLEAMAAGRAIVCTDNGGMAELVDYGNYGVLVPPKSPRDIAQRVITLLDNPTQRHELGKKAREIGLNRFEPATVIPQQIKSYERAIQHRQKLKTLQKAG